MRLITIGLTLALALTLTACDDVQPSSDQIQNHQQELLSRQAVQSVGMPAITHFFEKRQLKSIYELRDRAISTVTYLMDRNGKLHKICDSIGYGIPYATEYTNPSRPVYQGGEGIATVPQADPNGLYSPSAAAGTWVLCLNPQTKQTTPVYVEPDVVVSPFALQSE